MRKIFSLFFSLSLLLLFLLASTPSFHSAILEKKRIRKRAQKISYWVETQRADAELERLLAHTT